MQIKVVPDRNPKKQYTEQEKREAIKYMVVQREKHGKTWSEVSSELGIHQSLLQRWLKKFSDGKKAGFVRVAVDKQETGPVLVLPNGWRVEGLGVDGILEVLKRVS